MNFIWTHYREMNKDLIIAGLVSQTDYLNHYRNHGKNENRNYNIYMLYPDFNWIQYRNNYTDLKNKLHTKEQCELHWLMYGKMEGRSYMANTNEDINKFIIPKPLLPSNTLLVENKIVPTIYIKLIVNAGFGNLLFMVSIGLALGYEYNMNVKFIDYNESKLTRPNLKKYNIFKSLEFVTSVNTKCIEIKEPIDFLYNKISLDSNCSYIISGYFQSYKYFYKYIEQIKLQLGITVDRKEHHMKKIIIHVRRGDYLNYPDVHILIEESYYSDALNKYFENHNRDEYDIYLFTDGMNEVKEWMIIKKYNIIFNDTNNPEEIFNFMRGADHHIIANSSLSLISYYFKDNINSTLSLPPIWWNGLFDYNDMIPNKDLYIDVNRKLNNTFIINLEDRVDRRYDSLEQSNKISYDPIIFNAIKDNNGRIGCTMSHINVLKNAMELDLEYVVILEDDILICNENYIMYNVNKIMTMDWNVIILGGVVRRESQINNMISKVIDCQTTTGYIVNKKYYMILYDNLNEGLELLKNTNNSSYAIDIYWKKLQTNKWFCMKNKYIYQKSGYSNIENKIVDYKSQFNITKTNICEYIEDIPVINMDQLSFNNIKNINIIFHNYKTIIILINSIIIPKVFRKIPFSLLTMNDYDVIQLDCMNTLHINKLFIKSNHTSNAFILNNYMLKKIINNVDRTTINYIINCNINYMNTNSSLFTVPYIVGNNTHININNNYIKCTSFNTIILHHKPNTVRKKHIETILDCLKYNYKFFYSIPNTSKFVSGALSMIAIFNEIVLESMNQNNSDIPFKPVLILEDDVNITNQYSDSINIPPECDCIYMGISTSSVTYNKEIYFNGVPYEETEYNNIVRIKNMLSTHAFLITSKRYLYILIECMKIAIKYNIHYDIPIARIMHRYNVYALQDPYFYQDKMVGGLEEGTLTSFKKINKINYTDSAKNTCIVHFKNDITLNMINITFVSCWYIVKSKYSIDKYIEWIDNIMKNVNNYYLVVYTNNDSKHYLSKYSDNMKIKIIIKEYEDMYNYRYKDQWIKNHEKNNLLNCMIDWKLNMLWSEKIHFVYDTIMNKYFDTMYYGWCDIGYFRNRVNDTKINDLLLWPSNYIINNLKKDSIYYGLISNDINKNQLIQNQILNKNEFDLPSIALNPSNVSIGGGFFILYKDMITWWKEYYDMKLNLYFTHNYLVKDDQIILTDCIYSDETKFTLCTENTKYDNWFLFQRYLL